MITYTRYLNSEMHTWYDSTNVVYCKCYDSAGDTVTLKIVFKGGRTYLYKDVAKQDYLNFHTAQSNGEAFNKFIKPYGSVRIMDTSLDELNQLKESYIAADREIDSTPSGNLAYRMVLNNETGEFILYCGENPIYKGVEGSVSIVNLLRSMNIKYLTQQVDQIPSDSDESEDRIAVKPFQQPITLNEQKCEDNL